MAKKKASSKDSLISRMSESQIHELMRLFARVDQLAEAASRKAERASKRKTSKKRTSKKATSKKRPLKKRTPPKGMWRVSTTADEGPSLFRTKREADEYAEEHRDKGYRVSVRRTSRR